MFNKKIKERLRKQERNIRLLESEVRLLKIENMGLWEYTERLARKLKELNPIE